MKTAERIFVKIFTTEVSVDKQELIKSSRSSRCGSRNFSADSSTLQDGAFFLHLPHISGKNDRIFFKILSRTYPRTKKSGTRLALMEVCAASSGVTNAGVTRCGNWWCHPFLPQKVMTFLVILTTPTLSTFPDDRLCSVLAIIQPQQYLHFH